MRRLDAGDGDLCPVDAAHGHMYVHDATSGGMHQHCIHASHDGEAKRPIFPLFPADWQENEKRWAVGDR